ncbi:ankyrin repeat-containing domain protein [Aspergillus pseudoustus]|uniref:Ankyrin repeat-containing domain protein n=1 Tax=Aspergillus pseudoustus TaxID=1810923 RepID=A0ABR4II72_9EURO
MGNPAKGSPPSPDDEDDLPLHQAATAGDLTRVNALLDSNAHDPNTTDATGSTPLHAAAKAGHWSICRLLLERGALPTIQNGHDSLPLHLAAKHGHLEVVRLLLECDAKSKVQNRPLYYAAERGYTEIVRLLLERGASTSSAPFGENALHVAARGGHVRVCEVLLDHERKKTKTGMSLFRALGIGSGVNAKNLGKHTPFACAVLKGHAPVVQVFLRSGMVSISAKDRDGVYLFHRAVKNDHLEIVKAFLEHGVKVDMTDNYKGTALHFAAERQNVDIIRLLLDYGASLEKKDFLGLTPDRLAQSAELTTLMRNHVKQRVESQNKLAGKDKAPSSSEGVAEPPPEYTK